MKKLIAILAAVMLLSACLTACTVGPKEESREPLVTPDSSIPDDFVTEPALDIEAPVEPDHLPGDIAVSHSVDAPDDAVIPPAEPDITEPAADDRIIDDEQPVEISDAEYSFMYSTISLNVRKGPSTDYEAIGALKEGEKVEIIGYAADYGWYMIKFGSGVGYVSGSYMTPNDPNPEPDDDYPPIDIDMDRISEIINAYAAYNMNRPSEIIMYDYLGDYSAGAVVEVSVDLDIEGPYVEDNFGEYTLRHANAITEFYVYTPTGDFVLLGDAYDIGYITDSDMRAICYYAENSLHMHYVGLDGPSDYPQLDPLDHAAKAKIADDYDKANNLEAGRAYVVAYYGTYSGGDAVVMWTWDSTYSDISTPMTGNIKEFTVGGRMFYLSSGSLEIEIHTKDGKFVSLSKAYEQGIVSGADLDAISYYNLPSWYNQ